MLVFKPLMSYYISIGSDCSAAAALRGLNLRQQAYPFDWMQSSVPGIVQCIQENFLGFHEDIQLMPHGRRMIDVYGFEYPHDYPLQGHNSDDDHQIGEGMIGEQTGLLISDDWERYYPTVKEKYLRRIQRFREAMNDTSKPVIFLTRHGEEAAKELFMFLRTHYARNDLYMVNSDPDAKDLQFPESGFLCIRTEENGIWNEGKCWQDGIQTISTIIAYEAALVR